MLSTVEKNKPTGLNLFAAVQNAMRGVPIEYENVSENEWAKIRSMDKNPLFEAQKLTTDETPFDHSKAVNHLESIADALPGQIDTPSEIAMTSELNRRLVNVGACIDTGVIKTELQSGVSEKFLSALEDAKIKNIGKEPKLDQSNLMQSVH